MVDTETGELVKRRLEHGDDEAQKFYAGLSPFSGRLGISVDLLFR